MKIRTGFVSNSSSASFVIAKNALTQEQINTLLEYSNDENNNTDEWDITEGQYFIEGCTYMDNGDINTFLDSLNIPKESMIYIGD